MNSFYEHFVHRFCYVLPSLRLHGAEYDACSAQWCHQSSFVKGKGRPLGELKATFSTALKVLQCSKTIMSYDRTKCFLLALYVCAPGRGLAEKVLGLGQRRGGSGSPPPLYSPPNCRITLKVTHWLAVAPVSGAVNDFHVVSNWSRVGMGRGKGSPVRAV